MFLALAIGLFIIFTINVGSGAMGSGPFLGDVGEMVLLLAASLAFVVAILDKEAAARDGENR